MSQHPDIRREIAIAALGEHHQERIREGMPEVGWKGDPFLTLAYNKLQDRMEVWSEMPGRDPYCALRSAPLSEGVPNIRELCQHLADHDLHTYSAAQLEKRVDDFNLANEKYIQEKGLQKQAEALEKVYWSVGKDTGEYKPTFGYEAPGTWAH